MNFNSYVFLLAFLPVVIAGYYVSNQMKRYRLGQVWLLMASFVFIGYLNIYYTLCTLVVTVIGYFIVQLVASERYSENVRKNALIMGLFFHVSVLFFFKYFNFFSDNINAIFDADIPHIELLLPIGISFYTFQQIAYLVDCYKEPRVLCSLLEYMLYITFFPQFLQGPILLHEEMIPQLRDEKNKPFNMESFAKGLYGFSLGLAKKVLVADSIAGIVNVGYSNVELLNAPGALLTMVAYSLQLYFDFSGYCDMALGLGEMFQIRIPINFNSPYKAVKVTEIWSRWHMTLTRFFTRYLYIPLGGNRKGTLRMYVNTFIVFCISGLWHGAAWTFVVWGVLHGIAMIVSKWLERRKWNFPKTIGWFVTFSFWVLSFAIFRADSLTQAMLMFRKLFLGGIGKINGFFFDALENHIEVRILQRLDVIGVLEHSPELLVIAIIVISLLGCLFMQNTQEKMEKFRYTYWKLFVTVGLLFYSILSLGGITVFLYTNF